MAKRGQHSFLKRQKEIRRKEKAAGKMLRRQGKAEKSAPADGAEEVQALTGSDTEMPVQ
jgi:hypothetical protein